jgi:4-amino-4-deoxy-L-arabinose transferase-like glycosyltransferase
VTERAPRATRALVAGILLALAIGGVLRGLWLTADPPTHGNVGIVWHDEGPWAHNARNRALWGVWRTDAWNPVFIAPVFTGLEYAVFREFGVGQWQVRIVPAASGLLAIVMLAAGAFALWGPRAALAAALLLATNYPFVMWNRAALMESTMTAFIVAAWAAYALAPTRPRWGYVSGTMAALAWFSKAAAAFFLASLALDAVVTLALGTSAALRKRLDVEAPTGPEIRGARATLAGLVACAIAIGGLFVIPHWTEYRFYNWQMTVTRKPSYSLHALVERASWLPLVQGIFSKMALTLVAGLAAAGMILARLRRAAPAERLLILWLIVGLVELIAHDAGNERRYVMFIPAFVALASSLFAARESVGDRLGSTRWLLLPVAVLLMYLVTGTAMRFMLLEQVLSGDLKLAARLAIAMAVVAGALAVWRWPAVHRAVARTLTPALLMGLVGCSVGLDLVEYATWARHRTYLNYEASLEVGRALPSGTLVQGKLANGLSLENQIRPVFVGRGFGNYDDRRSRDDVRFLLTYVSPWVGYEGPVIRDVVHAYPRSTIVETFPVAETEGDHDAAALVDKLGMSGEQLLSGAPEGPTAGRRTDSNIDYSP